MKFILSLVFVSAVVHAAESLIERMENPKLTSAQRNDACFELRGSHDPLVLDSMLRALRVDRMRACAGTNLRISGDKTRLKQALSDDNPEVRALAARELGSFTDPALIETLAKAAADPNLLVSTNAVSALAQYQGASAVPYLDKIARKGGITGGLAFDRIAELHVPEALTIGRQLLQSAEPGDQIAAMRVIGESGDASDLVRLQEIAAVKDAIAIRQRGFGLMPALDLSRAAQATIAQIERRIKPR